MTDFDDLDSLMAEAEQEAAKKKLAKGAKPRSAEGAEAWENLQAEMTWNQVAICAVYQEEHCECGHSTVRLLGWYRYDQHRREAATYRWVAIEQPNGELETYRHTIRKDILWCKHCTHVYPEASVYGLPVEALGQSAEIANNQLELML